MNIYNFAEKIDDLVLDRGHDYFIGGNIVETYEDSENNYVFIVEGSDFYRVEVEIDDSGNIKCSECNCPYDDGPICKHQVAVYYKLRSLKSKKEESKYPIFTDVLNQLTKGQLIDIIADLARKDDALKNSIIIKYSKSSEEQELNKCKLFIDSLIEKYSDRDGFIYYKDLHRFTMEMSELIYKINNTEDPLLALDIALLMLGELVGVTEYSDDSGGEISFLLSEVIDSIVFILADSFEFRLEVREEMFEKIYNQLDNSVFSAFDDYHYDLLSLCLTFADLEHLRNKLITKIESYLSKDENDFSSQYRNESLLKILFNIIADYGTEQQALDFMKSNLRYSSFRKLYIDKYLQEENYHKVIEIALQGEEQDKNSAGLVSDWQNIRYEAYKKLSMKKQQRELAKTLLFKGNFKYYVDLKELTVENKEAFYDNLKRELKDKGYWIIRDVLLKIVILEKDFEELLSFVKENPEAIEEYAELLLKNYRDDVIKIYRFYIKARTELATNRKQYKKVCKIIKKYGTVAGMELKNEMIAELKALYKRRPALLDELSKI